MVFAHAVARMSPTTALIALSSLSSFTAAHALPRQTTTVPLRQLNVLPWPLAPTAAPELIDGGYLVRRQLNTVCGYVGGDPGLPATCSAGSHCVVDPELGAIGCCPDGGTCSQGVFTGCVDGSSPPQNEINPYVYTCQGDDLCYRNSFEGGFFQYGCGSTSGIETNVAASASGQSVIELPSVTAPLTADPSTLSDPTTLGTLSQPSSTEASSTRGSSTRSSATRSSSSSSTGSETSSTRASSSEESTSGFTSSERSSTDTSATSSATETSESSETSESATNTASESASATESDDESATSTEASAPDTDDSNDGVNTGAIIGGTISGIAALVALVVLGLFLWRRRKGNTRQGPGPGMKQQTEQVGPVSQNRHTFSPLPGGDDAHFPPPVAQRAVTPPERSNLRPDPYEPNYPYGYTATATAGDGAAVGAGAQMEHDQVPLTRELDDFSNGFNSALGRISEEEPRPGTAITSPMPQTYTPRRDGGGGALWQQNRGASWV